MPHPIPSPELQAWADCEIGVMFHYGLIVYEPSYRWRENLDYHPSLSIFDPSALDTDQWIEAAVDAGAKYAVLTAKQCPGFCLWPSKDYSYSIAQTPYKNGQGDIVGEFVASCRKYGVKPGLYYNLIVNAFAGYSHPERVHPVDSEAHRTYNALVEQQLSELWGNYGDLFEIWFDGGIYDGAPDVQALLQRYQPNAVCFQGPVGHEHLVRWVGNERGIAPETTWSTAPFVTQSGGTVEDIAAGMGDPAASNWIPAESDVALRDGEFTWYPDEEHKVFSVDKLLDLYYQSVGRNTNLLLGLVVDPRGLVPEPDRQVIKQFSAEIERRFANPLAVTQGTGYEVMLDLGQPTQINQLVLMEDIAQGERIREYVVEGYCEGQWQAIATGNCIGHKRIEQFDPRVVTQVRLVCKEAIAEPQIRQFAVYKH